MVSSAYIKWSLFGSSEGVAREMDDECWVMEVLRSFMKTRKSVGAITLPWGTPDRTGEVGEWCSLTETNWRRSLRKFVIHRRRWPRMPYAGSLWMIAAWGTVSKAAARSKKQAMVNFFWLTDW